MAVVGIDLGTTNTVAAYVRGGRVHVVADEEGRRLLPSVVSFPPSGGVLVGHAAKERRVVDARNTIASVKRLIGRAWDSDEIQRARRRVAFELKEGPARGPVIVVRGQEHTLPEISAFVLERAKRIAERALGEMVDRAVITVPAHFNELQRAATKVAGSIAGLEVVRIINEPTAAALAYGLGRSARERVAVYDFGGGTFDCTLLQLSGSVFEVLATAGDSFLGGDDLDLAIAERIAGAFLHAHRYDPRADPQAFERLCVAGERLKIELSSNEHAHAKLHEVAFGVGGTHLNLDFGLARAELDGLATPLVERTFAVCQEALSIARLTVSDFDKVILVGGSTRIPLVRQRVEQFFGRLPLDRVNPEEVVAVGAAVQAAALTGPLASRDIPPAPVPGARNPHPASSPLPVDTLDDEVTLSTDMTAILAEREKLTRIQEPPRVPDRSPVLVDVTPRALVVETVGGWCDVVVQRNSKIPCERTRAFATSSDGQTVVRVRVAQGEEAYFAQNTYLGEVELSGLQFAPRGQVTIQVRFEVDESGTLQVFATDLSTGREAHAMLQLVGIAGAESVAAMRTRRAALRLEG
ncbi:MAG: Hsp70 family protein [Myxococcota bacterium]|nr:Hsp70 family protein [Myxococcota bacterium]